MTNLLEYRVSEAHFGPGKIQARDIIIHRNNPYWSYARHIPCVDWQPNQARLTVYNRLLDNLKRARGGVIDLSPLVDDQRVSGTVFGDNPLQAMYDLIEQVADVFPEFTFYGKWGGGQLDRLGKGFAFYINDKEAARHTIEVLSLVAEDIGILIAPEHRYGIKFLEEFVEIDDSLQSRLKTGKAKFRDFLKELKNYPHFNQQIF